MPSPVNLAEFELAAGTIPGREHIRLKRGSQDALAWHHQDDCLIAVVCDGCGSGAHTEVGAKLGARLLVNGLRARLADGAVADRELLLTALRCDVLAHLEFLLPAMGGDHRDVVADYFLFTIVGAVITPRRALVFSIGDGVVAINGRRASSAHSPPTSRRIWRTSFCVRDSSKPACAFTRASRQGRCARWFWPATAPRTCATSSTSSRNATCSSATATPCAGASPWSTATAKTTAAHWSTTRR